MKNIPTAWSWHHCASLQGWLVTRWWVKTMLKTMLHILKKPQLDLWINLGSWSSHRLRPFSTMVARHHWYSWRFQLLPLMEATLVFWTYQRRRQFPRQPHHINWKWPPVNSNQVIETSKEWEMKHWPEYFPNALKTSICVDNITLMHFIHFIIENAICAAMLLPFIWNMEFQIKYFNSKNIKPK